MVLRDQDIDGSTSTGNLGISGSGLDQRIYPTNDARYDVTTLVLSTGTIEERFYYSLNGSQTYSLSVNLFNWQYGYQGGKVDTVTGLVEFSETTGAYNSPGRWWNTEGWWETEEPSMGAYVDGMNLYDGFADDPETNIDPSGMDYVNSFTLGPAAREMLYQQDWNSWANKYYPNYQTFAANQELMDMTKYAQSWKRNDTGWGLDYQCDEQADALQKKIWQAFQPRYWNLHVVGGQSNMGNNHNVLGLIPAQNNPLPSQYIDAFHYFPGFISGGNVISGPLTTFQNQYPNPFGQQAVPAPPPLPLPPSIQQQLLPLPLPAPPPILPLPNNSLSNLAVPQPTTRP